MFFWNKYPFIRLTIALIAGIIFQSLLLEQRIYHVIVLSILICLYSIVVALSSKFGYFQLRQINGVAALAVVSFLGSFLVHSKYQQLPSNHYQNLDLSKIIGFTGSVVSPPIERTNYHRYDLALDFIQVDTLTNEAEGVIHLYIKKDSISKLLSYGDRIAVAHNFYPVPPPKNPNEFDYKGYLLKKGIYAQGFVTNSVIRNLGSERLNPILYYAFQVRANASKIIDSIIPRKNENGIAKALLLGIREGLSTEIKKSYSSAGAMHVLAVSGLHVGIVYLLLKTLLSFLKGTLRGRRVIALLSIIIIWFYAIVTGLSPSVLRAATMFSIVAIGEINTTKGNVYNNLGFSAFILLMIDPYLIYSVGFQLSYAAVFGIVYLQPILYRKWIAPYWLLDKIWSITCVSIAAQLATFPLVAHYFHQFPTYFLVSNLIVIPAASGMLTIGLLTILIYPISTEVSSFLGQILEWIIWCVNKAMAWVEMLPNSLITWIYLDLPSTLLVYISTLCFLSAIQYRSFKTVILCFVVVVLFNGWNFNFHLNQLESKKITFYEIKGKTAIDHSYGKEATLYIDSFEDQELELLEFQINPNRLAARLPPIKRTISIIEESDNFEDMKLGFKLGVIDKLKFAIVYSTNDLHRLDVPIQTDFLLLELSNSRDLTLLFEKFRFESLILGNKINYWSSREIVLEAEKRNLPIHSLKKDGAFIWSYN